MNNTYREPGEIHLSPKEEAEVNLYRVQAELIAEVKRGLAIQNNLLREMYTSNDKYANSISALTNFYNTILSKK